MNLKVWQAYRAKCHGEGVEMTFEGAKAYAEAWKGEKNV